jgi:hypothetical protein
MGKAFQRHVECSVPCDYFWGRLDKYLWDLRHFGLWAFSHVSWLIQLPKFCFWDFIISIWNNWIGHITIGSIISDVFISELIFLNAYSWIERIEIGFSFQIHGECEEHD